MAVVRVRAYGSLSSYTVGKGEGKAEALPMALRGKRMKVRSIFSKLHIPEEAVSFVAINGVKVALDSWAINGDEISIFPLVAGG